MVICNANQLQLRLKQSLMYTISITNVVRQGGIDCVNIRYQNPTPS